jgi:CHAD domain-containing protein
MFRTCSPASLLEARISELIAHEPGLRDGDERSIHDARVATRRIREILGLLRAQFTKDELDDINRVIRKVRRALGDVRDPDVLHQLLADIEHRLPSAASATAPVRATVHQERHLARRRLVKAVDKTDLRALQQRLGRASVVPRWLAAGKALAWKETLRHVLASRAADVRAAVQRTGGVYFPNRSHSLRLAIKKLRYAAEIADATGFWRVPSALRRLKRAQDALGEAHDRQVLIDRLARIGESPATAREITLVSRVLEAEVEELHRKYAALRGEVIAICDAIDHHVRPRRGGRALIAAGIVVPSLVMLSRHAWRPEAPRSTTSEEEIRVPVLMP